jgi:SAM-dependent methyltransferase
MGELWNGTYKEPAAWEDAAEALIESTALRPGMRVLDLGSANGGTLFRALNRVGESGHVVGIEIEEDWAEWLQKEITKREIRNAENRLMDGRSMEFPDEAFDAVVMGLLGLDEDFDADTSTVIDDAPLMREVFRVLKPGHLVHCSGWLWQEDNEWMGELVRQHIPSQNKRGYFPMTEDGYTNLLGFAGFEEIRATTIESQYTFEDPAEWMACVGYMWETELEKIKADSEILRAFEQDAFALLARHVDDDGRVVYVRRTILVSARKPLP